MSADGGPAFGYVVRVHKETRWQEDPSHEFPAQKMPDETVVKSEGGMTMRDYFAAKAMHAAINAAASWSAVDFDKDMDVEASANFAYKVADAMLAARTK